MKYTNRKNLPPEGAEAISSRQDAYYKGEADFSVTELIDSPQLVYLQRKYESELVLDVHDLFSSWIGHLVHDSLEKPATARRLYCTVDGVVVSGAFDYYLDGVLKDYKTTSVWTVIYGSSLKKWTAQLNMYAYLLREDEGKEVEKAFIEAFMLDWSPSKAKYDHTYPQSRHMRIPIPLWTPEQQACYMEDRVDRHVNMAILGDLMSAFPECTPEEMWEEPTTYAVKKKKNKRASKVFTDKEAAKEFAKTDEDFIIETRVGARRRCEDYCDVSQWCPQFKNYKEKKNETIDSNEN